MLQSLIPLPIRRCLGNWWHARQAQAAKDRLLASLSGDAVTCNVCGWVGAAFTDDCWHPGTICPNCRSQVRHRILAACLDGLATVPGLAQNDLLNGRSILHFAPERQLRERIQSAAADYQTADFARGDCDHRLDISHMPEIADHTFDCVIACDVLEHVPDDASAFREIHRILRPGGTAILTVPQKDPPAETDEDPSVTEEAEREARFGQKDHVRMYGDDFSSRIKSSGFAVDVLTADSLPGNLIEKYVLRPPIPSRHPLATNFRRIFFARRQDETF